MNLRINIGCGETFTPGWANFDLWAPAPFAERPWFALLGYVQKTLGLWSPFRRDYGAFCRKNGIRYANSIRRIPVPDGSAEVIYASHMLEHLDRGERLLFLREARRALRSGGILRLAVPDLRYHIENYNRTGDADAFVEGIHMSCDRIRGARAHLRHALFSQNAHRWMYDGPSLCRLLQQQGFQDARVRPAGETGIPDPGPLNLSERSPESVFVEARKP